MAPTTAPIPLSPDSPGEPLRALGDELGEPLVQRPLAGAGRSSRSAAPGLRGPHEDEDPRAGRGGGLDQRLERVAAEQRVGVKASAPRPSTSPHGVGVEPTSAWA